MRRFHSSFGLIALVLACFLTLTGAMLSLEPVLNAVSAPSTDAQTTVAQLAGQVQKQVPSVERIKVKASGTVLAYALTDQGSQTLVIDPNTGESLGAYQSSGVFSWLAEAHREMFLGTSGRMLSGFGALSMLLLSVSGVFLIRRQAGSWSGVFKPVKGTKSQRLHTEAGRLVLPALLLSSLTGAYMSLVSLGIAPEGSNALPVFPAEIAEGIPASVDTLPALADTPLADLRELTFPYPNDPADVYTLKTAQGTGYVDQVSGQMLAFAENDATRRLYETIYMLHSGQGVWALALLLGLSSLSVPALSWAGTLIWWRRRRAGVNTVTNAPLSSADTVILVGSEGNTTCGFAQCLQAALQNEGRSVHSADMNAVSSDHIAQKQVFILTSTYGDGEAPASAKKFLSRLEQLDLNEASSMTLLGFGDSSFPAFCGYAEKVNAYLQEQGVPSLVPLTRINKMCGAQFAVWGQQLGKALGCDLKLEHTIALPETTRWRLIEREVYGEEFEEPTAILRFEAVSQTAPAFTCGDLFGVTIDQGIAPRFYSLASSHTDGYLEICVKRHRRGVCSTYLHNLRINDEITGFMQQNEEFKLSPCDAPKIMIGAGTGIAPLAGFARQAGEFGQRHLYWGGRHPNSDFLFRDQLTACETDGRLASFNTAFSRTENRQYVQDKLKEDASFIRAALQGQGQILICGGRTMANDVRATLDEILKPAGLSVEMLKQSRRYLEDVY